MRFKLSAVMLAMIPYAILMLMFWAKISQWPAEDGPYAAGLILVAKASFYLVFTLMWLLIVWRAPAAVRWLRRLV